MSPTPNIHAHLIGGEWVETPDAQDNINPSDTRQVVGRYASATADHVDQAVEAARKAFPSWSCSSPQLRHDILKRAAAEIVARKEELGRLLSSEEGKTLPEGIGEVQRAASVLDFMAGEALRIPGERLSGLVPGSDAEVTREPLGVIGIIAPWNFPIAIPAWKIAPALAYGNTVVFKPADLVPGSAWALVDILHRAGLPDGVLNLVMGKGSVIGAALSSHPGVDAISFTGSVPTGRRIAQAAVSGPVMKRLQLEMGGKNPLVIMDDANLELAVECAVQGAFYSTGQRCTASSRFIVTRGIHDRFVDAVIQRLKRVRVGHALHENSDIGPVVDARQLETNLRYIALGKEEGAELVFGGEQLERDTPGFYLQPAVFTHTRPEMRVVREEIFGPVATVSMAEDFDHALALANDTEFGLSAGICTSSLAHATHFKRHSQAGIVKVNQATSGLDFHLPFGGRKASSYGPREQGRYAVDFYTVIKTSYTSV